LPIKSKNAKKGTISVKIGIIACLLGILAVAPLAMGFSMNGLHVGSGTTTAITKSNESSTQTSSQTTTLAYTTTTRNEFGSLPSNYKIAFVKPVFTATAYSSFYSFYGINVEARPGQVIKTNLNLLNASLVNTWGWSDGLSDFINSAQAKTYGIILGKNSFVISDIDVDQGALFNANGTRRYDAVVIGFTEYVTQREYDNYRLFVTAGGRLILLDADNFFAQVAYYPASHKVALLLGHGWAFNGTAAWPSVRDRWLNESRSWVGSHDALYVGSEHYTIRGASPNPNNSIGKVLSQKFDGLLFKSYGGHEENILDNANDSIIAKWNVLRLPSSDSGYVVAAYELKDGNRGGIVIHSCVFGSDIIGSDEQLQFFVREAIYPNAIV
jgi:hypothetical protein